MIISHRAAGGLREIYDTDEPSIIMTTERRALLHTAAALPAFEHMTRIRYAIIVVPRNASLVPPPSFKTKGPIIYTEMGGGGVYTVYEMCTHVR